jgi:D-psicose/D-tagatose/L-ribulose 3-epimerase
VEPPFPPCPVTLVAMPPYRLALCNDIFQYTPLDAVCEQIHALGYEGVELAPFTLGPDPAALDQLERERIRRVISAHGLRFVGLHSILGVPEALHATTRDEAVRKRTWNYVHNLIDLCADLAGAGEEWGFERPVLVFGAGQQRAAVDGMTPREATDILTHELAHAAPRAETRGVKILLEALSPDQTNVVTCLKDAVTIVRQIGSPAIATMFDTHNAVAENEPHPELIRRYAQYIQHVHVNELDGREPGSGDYDFDALLTALQEMNYAGWVSVEAFDSSRDANEIGRRALERLTAGAPLAAASQAI